jgi:predicted HicB family RNase H-like nuclease
VTEKQKPISLMLRLPPDLGQWIKHQAVDNYRSFNSEVIQRLEQSRAQQKQQQLQGTQA